MFESLSQRLSGTIERLRGRARLTEANIRESLREVRIALLEADVALPVVQALIHPSSVDQDPVAIVKSALDAAKKNFADVLLVDTAGRLAIDAEMMAEIKALHAALNPVETLFVVDAMTGQDAANTAKAFAEALPLTGVILTKTDGDARGGAALSVRYITGRPIKFIGVSEKPDGLDAFHPDRL